MGALRAIAMRDLWANLPADAQDALFAVLLLTPALITGMIVLRGYAPGALVVAMLRRFAGVNAVFILLIAISVAVGIGLTAQERALRQGSAAAAAKFDLVVGAPGSEITLMLAAVYLQPSDVPLITGAQYAALAAADGVTLAAPIAFGDSFDGAPVVGTTAEFVSYIAGPLTDGAMFTKPGEAVAGAYAPVAVGDTFLPIHGESEAHAKGDHHTDEDAEEHAAPTLITGRMAPTGTPWDRAILVPVEAVWQVHGLANGHAPGDDGHLGAPFDAAYFPGTPAVLVRATGISALYALKSQFTTADTMAVFPGTVLAQLHSLMRDVRTAMSLLALVTQALVGLAVLAGLMILGRLYTRHLALLRALGAPRRFVFAVVWSYSAVLILIGAALGLALGWAAATGLSALITARTDVLVTARLGWTEVHLVAGFVSLTLLFATLPAFAALRRPVLDGLRT
jgi:putative ABC transport system permease protein